LSDYLRHVSIMIVDDQEFNAKILRQMLRVLGASDIRVFNNGEDAWEDFKERPVDMVITDWKMQPMSGLKLTNLIRNSPDSPNVFVPMILVTAFREREHVFKARDAGVTEYVVKPVSPRGLFSRIEAVIERPRRFVRVGDFFGPDRRRHTKELDGADRRGHEPPEDKLQLNPAATAAERKREMGQDEINNTFNPNDAPLKQASAG
jgi:two-component system chemotaxis response regulator CheY